MVKKKELKSSLKKYLGNRSDVKGIEITKINLREVTSMDKLLFYWGYTSSGSKLEKLVEARMIQVLSGITDLATLFFYWNCTFHKSELEKLIEDRMIQVLSGVTDLTTLFFYRDHTSSESVLREFIEIRIGQIVEEVSLNNIPEWFVEILQVKDIPFFVEHLIKEKAKELLQELSA